MIITISREYGSGGGEIAHKTAERLGVPCYDKTVAALTASLSDFSKEAVEEAEDKVAGVFDYIGGGYSAESLPVYDRIYLAQRAAILQLAKKGDCVLVGRCAAQILKEAGIPARNVFVYAPMEERVKRIEARQNVDERQAKKIIRKKDDFRRNYYKRYAYVDWGDRGNYDLLVNSAMGIEKAVQIIASAFTDGKK